MIQIVATHLRRLSLSDAAIPFDQTGTLERARGTCHTDAPPLAHLSFTAPSLAERGILILGLAVGRGSNRSSQFVK